MFDVGDQRSGPRHRTLLTGAKGLAETLDFIFKPLVLYDEFASGVGEAVCTEQALGGS